MIKIITGTSLDISTDNRARLKALFPSVFTETVNDNGELVESVDFEKLKAKIGTFTDFFMKPVGSVTAWTGRERKTHSA